MYVKYIVGFLVAIAALIGIWAYAGWGMPSMPQGNDQGSGIAKEDVDRFTAAVRAKVVAEIGQPIEGFEPFMFMQVYPGLISQDFEGVDALIGGYTVRDGEVMWDPQGEAELHSAARAISDQGMEQLLQNISARVSLMAGTDLVDGVIAAISPDQEPNPPTSGGDQRTFVELSGVVTCLPKIGPGPHTMECAFGLKADNGRHYALKNLWEIAPDITDTNVRIEVKGYLTAPEPNTSYDIEGVVDVMQVDRM